MNLHPAGIEVRHDAVEIDAQPHRNTIRSRAAVAVVALLVAVAGCGGDSGPSRSYSVGLEVDDSADEYDYIATDAIDVRVGDEVTFEFRNTGTLAHDLNVIDPDGRTIARAEPIGPGESVAVTAVFEQDGPYRISCFFDDHFIEHQMFSFIEVTDPES